MAGPEGVQVAEMETEKKKHHHHHKSHTQEGEGGKRHHHHHRKKKEAAEQPEAMSDPEWYQGLDESMGQFMQFQNYFGYGKESLSTISDNGVLDSMQVGADDKKGELEALWDSVKEHHTAMGNDSVNKDKHEEGEEFYENCESKYEVCDRMYIEFTNAIQDRKDYIREHPVEAWKQARKGDAMRRLLSISEKSPVMQLIRRIKELQSGGTGATGIKSVTLSGLSEIAGDAAQETLDQISEASETKENIEEAGQNTKDFIEGLQTGKVQEDTPGLKDKIGGVVSSVKGIADLVIEVADYLKDRDEMSEGNKGERFVSMITNGIQVALDTGKAIVDCIKQIPILGGIVGLIKNVVNFFHRGYTLYSSYKRIAALREQKRKLKEKMLNRKKKYAKSNKGELANLYSYVEEGKDGNAHIRKKGKDSVGSREDRGIQKADSAGKGQKASSGSEAGTAKGREYYEAKAEESLQQYDEIKEAIYRNKNVNRGAILDLIQEGIECAGNIASFIPGAGTIVEKGTAVLNFAVGAGRKGATFFQKVGRKIIKSNRTEENKGKFRGVYASHVYSCLKDVAEFVTPAGEFDSNLQPDNAKKVEDNYNYAAGLLEGVGADMPKLIGSKNQEELLGNLSSMFGVKG